jgi:hypothetical protein
MKSLYGIVCVSKLPSAGLGNKLFSWAAGVIFSNVNNCPHYIIGMTKFHLGPIMRNEKRKRFYIGFFKNEILFLPIYTLFNLKFNIPQEKSDQIVSQKGNYIFSEIPHWSDSYCKLKDYRSLIQDVFWDKLTDNVKNRILRQNAPFIGVHIRMGDFKNLTHSEDFSKVGAVRTPMSYFIEVINSITIVLGFNPSITVFSDGHEHELKEILSLPNVERAKEDLDIVHLALLSKSQIIIMSAGSSFSHWAGFLSDGILINHYQHLHNSIRPEIFNKSKYEGGLEPGKSIDHYPLLKQNLLQIKSVHIAEN